MDDKESMDLTMQWMRAGGSPRPMMDRFLEVAPPGFAALLNTTLVETEPE